MTVKVRTVSHFGSREVVEFGRGQREGVLGLMEKYNFLACMVSYKGVLFYGSIVYNIIVSIILYYNSIIL